MSNPKTPGLIPKIHPSSPHFISPKSPVIIATGYTFTAHLEETEGHVGRLEEIFDALGEEPTGETCKAMEGLIEEGEEYAKASGDPDVRDAGLIGAAQRVEHYEMAGYGTTRALAARLGESEAADTLQATLEEEAEADRKLTAIAEGEVNPEAAAS